MYNIYVKDCPCTVFEILIAQGRGTHHYYGDIELVVGDLFINLECNKDGVTTKRIIVEEIIDILPNHRTTMIATIVKTTR